MTLTTPRCLATPHTATASTMQQGCVCHMCCIAGSATIQAPLVSHHDRLAKLKVKTGCQCGHQEEVAFEYTQAVQQLVLQPAQVAGETANALDQRMHIASWIRHQQVPGC